MAIENTHFEQPVWRPAREVRSRRPNNVWRCLAQILEPAIKHTEPATIPDFTLQSLYTYKRLKEIYKTATPERLKSLPSQWSNRCSQEIGYLEADLLMWLTRGEGAQNVMTLLASRGVGKTVTLHHTLRVLVPQLGDFERPNGTVVTLWPIVLDLRSFESPSPTAFKIIDALVTKIRDKVLNNSTDEFCPEIKPILANLTEEVKSSSERRFNNGILMAAIEAIRKHWSRKSQLLPVFGLDNVDKLHGASIEAVLGIARALAIESQCKVIIPARPWTRFQEARRSHVLGQFITNTVSIPTPDLASILKHRIKTQLIRSPITRLEMPFANRIISFEPTQIESVTNYLVDILQSANITHKLLVDLCNYDVRHALFASRALLRYTYLPIDTFLAQMLTPSNEVAEVSIQRSFPRPKREWAQTTAERLGEDGIAVAVMVDDRHVYCAELEHGPNIVLNLFDAGMATATDNCTVQYRILAFLQWRNELVSREELRDTFMALGCTERLLDKAIHRLFEAGLLDSPESDEDYRRVDNLSLSISGEYYLTWLSRSPDYILECLPDTPLSHLRVDRSVLGKVTADSFPLTHRIDAWIELLYRVYLSERDSLSHLQVNSDLSSLFDPRDIDLLCSHLLNAARQLIANTRNDTRHTFSPDDLRAIDRLESETLVGSLFDRSVTELRNRFTKTAKDSRQHQAIMPRYVFALHPTSECVLEWPSILHPSGPSYAKIEISGSIVEDRLPIQMCITMENARIAFSSAESADGFAAVIQMGGAAQISKVRIPLMLASHKSEPPRGVIRAIMSGSLVGQHSVSPRGG